MDFLRQQNKAGRAGPPLDMNTPPLPKEGFRPSHDNHKRTQWIRQES